MDPTIILTTTLILLLVACLVTTALTLRQIRSKNSGLETEMAVQLAGMKEQQAQVKTILQETQNKNLTVLQDQFKQIVDTLHTQQQSAQTNLTGHMTHTGETLNKVHAQLAGLAKTAEGMASVGTDVNRLHDLLKAPKLRGNLGELLLENLLRQVLPKAQFQMQYRFKDETVVDAAIFLGESIVPIDSKFPLEAFQRATEFEAGPERNRHLRQFGAAVRKQIVEIADKYIKPVEGTYDFALMYIPSESVYYEIATHGDTALLDEARSKHVIPVSPNTFYAYLMAIAYGLKGFQIEKEAKGLRAQLGSLEATFRTFGDQFQTLGKHLTHAQNKFSEADRTADKFAGQLANTVRRPDALPTPVPTDEPAA